MIKRLIFDVDGTLIAGVDFMSSVVNCLKRNNLYSEENIKNFFAAMKTYEGVYDNYNTKDYLSHLGSYLGTHLDDSFLDIFFDELKFCIPKDNTKLVNAIEELSSKYELVLLTNYFKKSQLNRLNNMGIGQFFTECYGEELIKPNEMIYIRACGNNNPNECVMIGDDLNLDIEGATALGLNTIFVNSKNIPINNHEIITVSAAHEITDELIKSIRSNDLKR